MTRPVSPGPGHGSAGWSSRVISGMPHTSWLLRPSGSLPAGGSGPAAVRDAARPGRPWPARLGGPGDSCLWA